MRPLQKSQRSTFQRQLPANIDMTQAVKISMCQISVRTISRRTAFTILEILVSMAVVAVLVALIFPAVQKARESSRRLQCCNNLRQIGLALHNHHDVAGQLPQGWTNAPSGQSAWGWATTILPMLEQSAVAAGIHRNRDVQDPLNESARHFPLATLVCPSDSGPPRFSLFMESHQGLAAPLASSGQQYDQEALELPRANYVGIFGIRDPDESPGNSGEGTFLGNKTIRWQDLTRGLSNVAIIGERTARRLPATWVGVVLKGEDAVARLTAFAGVGPNAADSDECEMDSRHAGGINVLFADGHVQHIADHVDRHVYQSMARRQ